MPNPRFTLSSADGDTLALRGVDSPRDDPERVTPEPENIVVLAHYHPLMVEAFARFPSDEWVRVGALGNVPLQPVRTPEEALVDPALLAEGAVVDVVHPVHGHLRQAGILYGLSRTPGRVAGPVPLVGEHSAAVRAEAAAGRPDAPAVPRPAAPGPAVPERCPDGPLSGITVLDLGFAVAGPFGTQVLADLGANVIKVNARRDPWWHASHIAYGANRGKRSVGIDLKHPEGLAVLHRLVARADVVHSNMRRDALRAPAGRRGVAAGRQPRPDLLPHAGLRPRAKVRLARQRPDGLLARRGHLRGRWLPRRRPAVLEPHLAGRHRQRVLLGDRRDPGAVPPRPAR